MIDQLPDDAQAKMRGSLEINAHEFVALFTLSSLSIAILQSSAHGSTPSEGFIENMRRCFYAATKAMDDLGEEGWSALIDRGEELRKATWPNVMMLDVVEELPPS